MEQSMTPGLLADDALKSYIVNGREIGFSVDLQMNRNRSLPLSCIQALELKIDGASIAPEDIAFCVNNKQFMIAQLKDLYAEYWNFNERARLICLQRGGLQSGKHLVEVTMHLRSLGAYVNDAFDMRRVDIENLKFAVDHLFCGRDLDLG